MFELFPNHAPWMGFLIWGSGLLVQIGLLVLAVLGQKKWQWKLMFIGQACICVAAISVSLLYNHMPHLSLMYLDDALWTIMAVFLYLTTLFVSWVFWMNRKTPYSKHQSP